MGGVERGHGPPAGEDLLRDAPAEGRAAVGGDGRRTRHPARRQDEVQELGRSAGSGVGAARAHHEPQGRAPPRHEARRRGQGSALMRAPELPVAAPPASPGTAAMPPGGGEAPTSELGDAFEQLLEAIAQAPADAEQAEAEAPLAALVAPPPAPVEQPASLPEVALAGREGEPAPEQRPVQPSRAGLRTEPPLAALARAESGEGMAAAGATRFLRRPPQQQSPGGAEPAAVPTAPEAGRCRRAPGNGAHAAARDPGWRPPGGRSSPKPLRARPALPEKAHAPIRRRRRAANGATGPALARTEGHSGAAARP